MLGAFCAGLPTMYSRVSASAGAAEAVGMSRVLSLFLLFMYAQFMLFQLGTHRFLFGEQSGLDDEDGEASEEEDEEADMSAGVAACVLGICTVLCTFNSEFMISSISGVVNSGLSAGIHRHHSPANHWQRCGTLHGGSSWL